MALSIVCMLGNHVVPNVCIRVESICLGLPESTTPKPIPLGYV